MAILTGIYVMLTAAYVLISLHTLKAINRQATLTEQQGESSAKQFTQQFETMRGQLAVMERQLAVNTRQWVDINEWTVGFAPLDGEVPQRVTIAFNVSNPTRLPLTLEMVETKTDGMTVATTERFSLIPDSHYRVYATFKNLEEMDKEYSEGSVTILIQITIWFSDVMKKGQEQYFGGELLYDVKTDSVTFYPRAEMVPKPPDQDGDQKND